MLYSGEYFEFSKVILCIKTCRSARNVKRRPAEPQGKGDYFSLSKTTKLILLDSLLQEVCISSDLDRSLTFEFAQVECLCFSVTKFFIQG